jgi:sugar/nucleoside kinase (ribokinase family)
VAIVVVGGSGKDVGKTGVVCAVISALREYEWTAVKITGHDYPAGGSNESSAALVIREETRAGEETDTARFLRAGAKRALLVTRVGDEVPMDEIRAALGSDRNVVFESNRILDTVKPDVCLALVGGDERKASFVRLMRAADAVLTVQGSAAETLREGVRRFQLESVDRLPAELLTWLRERLDRVVTPRSEGR